MADTRRLLPALQTLLADNVSEGISPQDLRDFLVSSYPGEENVKNHGAVGDGSNDDTTAIQAAIDAAEAVGNGAVVRFPRGRYKTSALLTINKGIYLKGEGYGDVSPITSNIMSTANSGTTIIFDSAASATGMFHFISASVDETLHGGGIMGMLIDGNNKATTLIRASSCRETIIDVATFRPTTEAILLDDVNNKLCDSVYIPRLIARLGSDVAAEGAHGIHILGDVANNGGCTNHFMGDIDVEYNDGDGIRFIECDSCYVAKFKGSLRDAGNGRGLFFGNGTTFPCQKNVIAHGARCGKIVVESSTIANRVMFLNSEGSSVDNSASTGMFSYDVHDRIHGDHFTGQVRYPMSDRLSVPLGGFLSITGSPLLEGIGGMSIPGVTFDSAVTETIALTLAAPWNWNNGNITGAELTIVGSGTASGDVVVQLDLNTRAHNGALGGSEKSQSFTITPSGTTSTITRHDIIFTTALPYLREDTIGMQFSRLGADGDDNRNNDMYLMGLKLIFECDGPDGVAATWDIPINQDA